MITMTFDLDLDKIKMNHYSKYPGHMSFHSKLILRTHTHRTDCSTRITKVVGNKSKARYKIEFVGFGSKEIRRYIAGRGI